MGTSTGHRKTRLFTLLSVALAVLLFAPVAARMMRDAVRDGDQSYAVVVPLVSAFLLWGSRRDSRGAASATSAAGAVALAGSLFIFVLGEAGGLDVVQRLGMIGSVNALVWALAGTSLYRTVRFPLLFLFFAIPVPVTVTGTLTLPLQLLASASTFRLLSACGVPIHRAGNLLSLPSGALDVAEACSGLRSLFALVTLAVLLAHLWRVSGLRGAALVALAVPAALIGNVFRIAMTALGVLWFGPAAAQGRIHESLGLLSFFVGLGLFSAASRLFAGEKIGDLHALAL